MLLFVNEAQSLVQPLCVLLLSCARPPSAGFYLFNIMYELTQVSILLRCNRNHPPRAYARPHSLPQPLPPPPNFTKIQLRGKNVNCTPKASSCSARKRGNLCALCKQKEIAVNIRHHGILSRCPLLTTTGSKLVRTLHRLICSIKNTNLGENELDRTKKKKTT